MIITNIYQSNSFFLNQLNLQNEKTDYEYNEDTLIEYKVLSGKIKVISKKIDRRIHQQEYIRDYNNKRNIDIDEYNIDETFIIYPNQAYQIISENESLLLEIGLSSPKLAHVLVTA